MFDRLKRWVNDNGETAFCIGFLIAVFVTCTIIFIDTVFFGGPYA